MAPGLGADEKGEGEPAWASSCWGRLSLRVNVQTSSFVWVEIRFGEPLWICTRSPLGAQVSLRREVVHELARFLWLLPLAFINLRIPADPLLTTSDASTSGGGITVSRGLTPYGAAASTSWVRGDLPEEHDFVQVLSIGLFDGISALRVALDALGLPIAGHVSIEARPVVESFFPDTIFVEDVESVDEAMVLSWSLQVQQCGCCLDRGWPALPGRVRSELGQMWSPCDICGVDCLLMCLGWLICARKPLFGHKFVHWPKMWHQWDYDDCSHSFEDMPWYIDAGLLSLSPRPRLYWVSWELMQTEGSQLLWGSDGTLPIKGDACLQAELDRWLYLEPGWSCSQAPLPTFTTSRPSPKPMRKPANLSTCEAHEVERWKADRPRFPPYKYPDSNCVVSARGEHRPPMSQNEKPFWASLSASLASVCLRHHVTPSIMLIADFLR